MNELKKHMPDMEMINQLLELGNRYAAKSDWKDFALTKFCLCSMGVIIGTFVSKKRKGTARLIAGGVFGVTYVILMKKVLAILLEMVQEDEDKFFY